MAERSFGGDALKGAVAGAVATWAMDQVTRAVQQRQDVRTRGREWMARGGRGSPSRQAAGKLARRAGVDLSRRQRAQAGTAVHYGLGVAAGAAYGVLRGRVPGLGRTHGLGYGAAFFLFVDETLAPALNLAPSAAQLPWQSHVRGLSGHLVFGTVADLVLEGLDRLG